MIADALRDTIKLIETTEKVQPSTGPIQQELSYLVNQMKIVRARLLASDKS